MVAQGHTPRTRASAGIADQAARQAAIIAQQLRQRGDRYLDDQKHRAVDNISAIGAAVRRAADKLHDSKTDAIAQYVAAAADGLDGISRYIDEQDIQKLAGEVGRLMQRKPALVLGGLFIAGLTLGRFSKATSPARARAATRKRSR
jgi:hypothetical protein